jgi:hypothetical protein
MHSLSSPFVLHVLLIASYRRCVACVTPYIPKGAAPTVYLKPKSRTLAPHVKTTKRSFHGSVYPSVQLPRDVNPLVDISLSSASASASATNETQLL